MTCSLPQPRRLARPRARALALAIALALCSPFAAEAQVSIGINVPGISIGINVPVYPQLVAVPGYPVYYDPRAESNYFFYDGFYWVYSDDRWYQSGWYDGPWQYTEPEDVPVFVLRVPVGYYRQPPVYFQGWRRDAPPRWGDHWGPQWQDRRPGWDRWDRRSVPVAAPLPSYQQHYRGDRYPRAPERQEVIRSENYRFQPTAPVVQPRAPRQEMAAPPPVRAEPRSEQRAPQPMAPRVQAPAQRASEPGRQPRAPSQSQERGVREDNGRGQGRGRDPKDEERGGGPR